MARRLRDHGTPVLKLPANYYDDLQAEREKETAEKEQSKKFLLCPQPSKIPAHPKKEKKKVLVVPADNRRPAAKEQLIQMAKNAGVERVIAQLRRKRAGRSVRPMTPGSMPSPATAGHSRGSPPVDARRSTR